MSFLQHKFLDCIRAFIDGIVEMEETFVTEFFKYNHKKSGFKMLRPARERGKQVKKRGISNEQICIATVIDRGRNLNVLGQILLQRLHFCTHCTCCVVGFATNVINLEVENLLFFFVSTSNEIYCYILSIAIP